MEDRTLETLVYLLAVYGIVHAIQHKLPTIRYWGFRDLLDCSFCLGFWIGGLIWVLSWYIVGVPTLLTTTVGTSQELLGGLVWAFASASFSYLLANVTAKLEEGVEI